MSIGLIALLDDIVAIARVAAASVDDVAGQAAKAGVKAAGVIIDDTAVTLSYVIGFASGLLDSCFFHGSNSNAGRSAHSC
jgi:predicted DNA repair protein MutK